MAFNQYQQAAGTVLHIDGLLGYVELLCATAAATPSVCFHFTYKAHKSWRMYREREYNRYLNTSLILLHE